MKLIEFDLDAPHLPRASRASFRSKSRATTALYERCFEGFRTDDCWKILVECVTEITQPEPIDELGGVLVAQTIFDFDKYESLQDDYASKTVLADALFSGITIAAKAKNWPQEPFKRAARQILELKLVNEWWWKKPKWNPRRTLRGQLWCVHSMESFTGYLVIKDKNGNEVMRRKVIDTRPSEFVFASLFGVTKWTSATTFTLFSKEKIEVGSIASR